MAQFEQLALHPPIACGNSRAVSTRRAAPHVAHLASGDAVQGKAEDRDDLGLQQQACAVEVVGSRRRAWRRRRRLGRKGRRRDRLPVSPYPRIVRTPPPRARLRNANRCPRRTQCRPPRKPTEEALDPYRSTSPARRLSHRVSAAAGSLEQHVAVTRSAVERAVAGEVPADELARGGCSRLRAGQPAPRADLGVPAREPLPVARDHRGAPRQGGRPAERVPPPARPRNRPGTRRQRTPRRCRTATGTSTGPRTAPAPPRFAPPPTAQRHDRRSRLHTRRA